MSILGSMGIGDNYMMKQEVIKTVTSLRDFIKNKYNIDYKIKPQSLTNPIWDMVAFKDVYEDMKSNESSFYVMIETKHPQNKTTIKMLNTVLMLWAKTEKDNICLKKERGGFFSIRLKNTRNYLNIASVKRSETEKNCMLLLIAHGFPKEFQDDINTIFENK